MVSLQATSNASEALRRVRALVPEPVRSVWRRARRRLLGAPTTPSLAVAVLLPDGLVREVRGLQEALRRSCGASPDLESPPHVTLKLGFRTGDPAGLERCVTDLARATGPIDVTFGDVAFFDEGIVYLEVATPEQLEGLRRRLLAVLRARLGVTPYDLETGGRYRLHVTLSHGVARADFERFRASLAPRARLSGRLERIGVLREQGNGFASQAESPLAGPAAAARGGEALERLRYRRQFLLGPASVRGRPGWSRLDLPGGGRLVAHPELEVTHAADGARSVTLIGFLLDPEAPRASNAELAGRLLGRLGRWEDVLDATRGLGGRWALIVDDGSRRVLFHDAGGQRHVHHARGPAGEVWCASMPGLLAEALDLRPDEEAMAFMATRADVDGYVYWMPGDTTVYREVKALLPNHLLDLGDGGVRRYRTGAGTARRPASEVVPECVRLLRGLFEAARHRAPLAIPMTAGWDSRLMLALARAERREVWCYTLVYPELPADIADVVVPARLLGRLGLSHHLIAPPASIDPEFKAIERANVSSVKAAYGTDAQALAAVYPAGLLCVTGDVAEVVKCHYRLPAGSGPPTAHDLARFTLLGDHPFVLRAFEAWLAGAPRDDGDPLDLFCWEQVAGRWQALIRAEYDIVQECLAPVDCRALLALLLSVDEVERRPPGFPLLRAIIAALWPETLQEPINPPEPVRLRSLVGLALRRLHLHDVIPDRLRRLGRRRA